MRKPWTREDIDALEQMYVYDQLPIPEIAAQMDRTPTSIKSKRDFLGLTRGERSWAFPTMRAPARGWSELDLVNLQTWFLAGVSVLEIGRRLGRSEDSVIRRAKALGLSRPRIRPRGFYQRMFAA